jgi:cysteinyl-tRNA synthetase
MEQLNSLPPSIEPQASAHIIEQAEMVEQIFKNGFAYEVNGSVYFDVAKYSETNNYGKLSGRVLEDLQNNTRELAGQSDKKNSFDFALWKKAEPEHIMRWPSKWSDGFPGWHLECSVMSTKYLGDKFDIHGGGLDLQFPHHECEIAQSKAAKGEDAVKYWMHNNLITIDGQKMSKSLNNFIMLDEMFNGKHKLLEQAYSPMVVRFFILQAHYRSTLDFSNKALQASEKGYKRLMTAVKTLNNLKANNESSIDVKNLKEKIFNALDDDMNTPILIAHLFDGVKMINSVNSGDETISKNDLSFMQELYNDVVFEILGLKDEDEKSNNDEKLSEVMELVLKLRAEAKKNKDFATSDKIRNELNELGIVVKDTREGSSWELN